MYRRSSSAYSEASEEVETDFEGSTDDEPTIRPSHSCASSDTQSLFSNDASASEDGHSSYDIHGDEEDDEEGDEEQSEYDDLDDSSSDYRPSKRRRTGD